MKGTLFTDGGARGNPGPAGAGAVVFDGNGRTIGEAKRYLGTTTNNTAEYTALIMGLDMASQLGVTELDVCMDSELIVKQMNGEYRVKQPHLRELAIQVGERARRFVRVTYRHVRRERNKDADRLVNEAIDEALSRVSG